MNKSGKSLTLFETLDQLELELRHIKLLLDRQYLDPFVRMDEKRVKEVKGEVRIYL